MVYTSVCKSWSILLAIICWKQAYDRWLLLHCNWAVLFQ